MSSLPPGNPIKAYLNQISFYILPGEKALEENQRNKKDGGDQINVEHTFYRASEEKAYKPIFSARMMMIFLKKTEMVEKLCTYY